MAVTGLLTLTIWSSMVDYTNTLKFEYKLRMLNAAIPDSFSPLMATIFVQENLKGDVLAPYIKFYKRVIKYFPNRADAHGMLGFCYYHMGDKGQALIYYRKAAELEPSIFWFHYNLGVIFFQKGFIDYARRFFYRALQTDPVNTLDYIRSSRVVFGSLAKSSPDYGATGGPRLKAAYQKANQLMNYKGDVPGKETAASLPGGLFLLPF